jgi:hypothetical protein
MEMEEEISCRIAWMRMNRPKDGVDSVSALSALGYANVPGELARASIAPRIRTPHILVRSPPKPGVCAAANHAAALGAHHNASSHGRGTSASSGCEIEIPVGGGEAEVRYVL